jgi:glycosyltransferase involved in cell wall biosynthesis
VNVLISSGFRWWNAEAAYAARLAELLRGAGHGAWVVAPGGTANAEGLARRGLEPLTGLYPSSNPFLAPVHAARLTRFVRERRIDVVDSFSAAEFAYFAWAARRVRGVTLVRARGGARPERVNPLNRWLYGDACDGVIASCGLIRERLVERLGVEGAHVRTIHYPAPGAPPVSADVRQVARARLLAELGHPPDAFVIAVVGRIAPEKGHALLLEALQSLRRELPRAVLWIANKAEPGEAAHREVLQRRIAAMGLEDAVRWLGFRDDVREVMAACDLGAVPSVDSEMNCRVAVEFFDVGTPVLAFPTGALPEVVIHGRSGWVTADRDAGQLAEAILALARDADRLGRLGAGARAQAEGRFAPQRFLDQTLAAFKAAQRDPP